jgi:hypothetical protein
MYEHGGEKRERRTYHKVSLKNRCGDVGGGDSRRPDEVADFRAERKLVEKYSSAERNEDVVDERDGF